MASATVGRDCGPRPPARVAPARVAVPTTIAASPSWLRSWFRALFTCALFAATPITSACTAPLTDAECSALLDRYTERLLRNENPEASDQLVAEKQAAARQVARDNPRFEFDKCAARVTRSQFECAMQAHDVDTIEQCLIM